MTALEDLLIRPAGSADCAGIAAVQLRSYRTAYASFFPPSYFAGFSQAEQEQEWRELLGAQPVAELLVALDPREEVIGYVLAHIQETGFPGYGAEVIALHVRQEWKGHGVGGALLGAAVSRLRARGCNAAMLWTLQGNPARAWYERLGGQLLGEKRYDVDGWEITEVAYGWPDLAALLSRLGRQDANDDA